MPPAKYNDRAYRKARQHLRDTADPVCHVCGGEIDLDAENGSPGEWTADHVTPLAVGGELRSEHLKPAHRGCNARRGDGRVHIGRGQRADPSPGTLSPLERVRQDIDARNAVISKRVERQRFSRRLAGPPPSVDLDNLPDQGTDAYWSLLHQLPEFDGDRQRAIARVFAERERADQVSRLDAYADELRTMVDAGELSTERARVLWLYRKDRRVGLTPEESAELFTSAPVSAPTHSSARSTPRTARSVRHW